jgi:hypothetical protein
MANRGPLSTILSDAAQLGIAVPPALLGSWLIPQVPFWKLWVFAFGVSLFGAAVRGGFHEFKRDTRRDE